MQKRELLLVASLIAVAAAVGTYHVACSGQRPQQDGGTSAKTPDRGDRKATVEIFGINKKGTLSVEDVTTLTRFMSNTSSDEELILARDAVVVSADRLKNASVPPEERVRLEGALIATLSHPLWRMRHSGLAALANYPLSNRPDVIEKMKLLRNDSSPEVAQLAKRLKLEGE